MLLRDKDRVCISTLAIKILKTPSQIWAFGSRINGKAHDTSDLDLVIVTDNHKKLPINEFISFKEAIKNSNIPILVQILDWERIPESFHQNILDNYTVLVKIRGLTT